MTTCPNDHMIKIGIINYGMGNLGSVKRKLDRIKASSLVSSDPEELKQCDKWILPGVGHFNKAVQELKSRQLWDFLHEEVLVNKKPILGICLGMQLMASFSEEGHVAGMGWIEAQVVRFAVKDALKYKVPHMGWNQVAVKKESPLYKDVDLQTGFYFVHSYHLLCQNPSDILTTTEYEYPFTSSFQKDNLYGVQFHPEKSHEAGERLLRNFVDM